MRSLLRSALAALLLASAATVARFAMPHPAFACSCAPTRVAEFVGKPDFVILTGVVRGVHPNANGNESGTLTVNRVFQGVVPRHELPVLGGGGGDCTIPLDEGMQFVGVATIDRGAVAPALCLPFGDLRDGSGQQILADIQRLLPGAPPIETGTGDVAASAVIAIVGLAIGVSVIGGTILVARRRGSAA